ncbi:hypothetical protein BU17DRAFT_66029 [Hysterangium stoloniferum]|nr:hypothetical protein BU17DRAFT_66029 [Hysterangium stoloniferum]
MSPGNRSALSAKAGQLQAAKTLLKTCGASPSPTLLKDFDSSKHISCEIPTPLTCETDESITPPPPLYDDKRSSGEICISRGAAPSRGGKDRSQEYSSKSVVDPELKGIDVFRPVSPTLLSESSLDSSDRLLEDFIDTSYHKRGGDDSINFWSHLTFCGTESPGTLLNVPYSNIVERLHYGSQNFIATPFTDVSVALTDSTYVSIFWKKKPRNITMRVPGRFIKNNTDELVTAIMVAKEKPLDVTFNIGEDSQYLTILNLLCHGLITSNRVAALCAEEIIGVTLIRSRVSHDVIHGSTNEASIIDYEGLVLTVNAS